MKPEDQHPGSRPDYANRVLLGVIAVLLLTIIIILLKVPQGPPPSPPHLPPGWPQKFGKLKADSGMVIGYKSNPHFDVNAITVQTAHEGLLTLDFLPHTAKTIMNIAPRGQLVIVKYSIHPDDEAIGYQLRQIKNAATASSAVLDELPPPPDVPDHNTENFKLEDPELITDRFGGVVAFKKNNMLFHFKPGLIDDIAPLIKTGHIFYLTAIKRDGAGFVNIDNDKVFVVMSITINKKTFLVR